VWLSGEAFFDVAQNAVHPFIVVTGGLRTKVLGTSFNIQAYPSQRDFGVTVVSGKVAVSEIHTPATLSKENPVTLSPRQQAVFNNTTRAINVKDHVDAEQFLLRRTGILKYKGAPVQEVVNTLGNYYNVTINIEGPTEDCFYFGEFNIDKGLDKALEQLCLTLNATLVKKGSAYVIRKGRC
jgi:ferric-dicitrate binding protein FerR (iron transport regulator)